MTALTSVPGFPSNVVELLASKFLTIEGLEYVLKRPLRPTDPDMCLGVFPLDWVPGEFEIGGAVNINIPVDPVTSTYLYAIQAFVKHGDEEEGILKHTILSKIVRAMLYRDTGLRVALAALNETSLGMKERTQRWGVRTQRFIQNEISGQFVFLSTMDFWLETEVVPA